MKIYRSAIVGARRGLHHARAYQGIDNMKVVAICEKDENLRASGERELGVKGYADYEEMLHKERPDIVHAVTMPTIPRAVWVEPAANAGVKVLVIEKPIALRPKEAEELHLAWQRTGLKIIVNHQRRYMPFAMKFRQILLEGKLGDIHFIRASTEGDITDMDTHLMDLVLMILSDQPPTAVWASIQGKENYKVPWFNCPDDLMAIYTFPNGTRVFFESARKAFGTADFPNTNPRCNIDVWATNGRMWWRENGSWGYQINGERFSQRTSFNEDDMPAQKLFTKAIANWLEDEDDKHLCRYEIAKIGFDAVMSAYRSALLGRRLKAPEDTLTLTDQEWEKLKEELYKRS